jgi:hypothetical protein
MEKLIVLALVIGSVVYLFVRIRLSSSKSCGNCPSGNINLKQTKKPPEGGFSK